MAINVIDGPIIRAGQSLSEPCDCRTGQVVRIHTPTDWTPAPLTFQISINGTTWFDLFNVDGQEAIVQNVVPSTAVLVQMHQVRSVWVKFRSGWRANPKPQDAERMFTVIVDAVKPGGGPMDE